MLGRKFSSISRIVRRFNEIGGYIRRQGQGQKRCTNQRDHRFLRQAALRNRTVTSNVTKHELSAVPNVVVPFFTIRRRK